MIRQGWFIIVLFLFLVDGYSQKKPELGNVTIEELSQKAHPIDTSAAAAILFKTGALEYYYNSNVSFTLTKVNYKIKIYKKEGLELANQKVSFFVDGSESEKVTFSNVATYNLEDGKVVKTKLKSDGEFVEKITKNRRLRKITLPSVKVGSIIEFSYEISSPYINSLRDWEFQSKYPTDFVEYVTKIPGRYAYNTTLIGSEKINVKSEELSSIRNGEMTYTYSKENVPAIKEEKYVNNIENYTSTLKYELASINYRDGTVKKISTDWETITKLIYDNESFGAELNKTGYFEDDITKLIAGLRTQNEKISAILNFVKAKVKWNKYNGYYCDEGVKTAYKNGVGNTAEINLMLTAMLRFAEIDANPILVSTRANGISFFPSRNAYNYVIAGIEVENNVILLDATDVNSMPDILPIRDLNWYGRIIRKNGSSANIDLMPKMKSSEVINLIATIDPDGTVEGKIRDQYYDYNAYLFRDYYGSITEESYLETLEKNHNNIEVEEYNITGKKELDKPIVENYSFKSTNSVEIIGDKILFSPLLFFAIDENPFKSEKREYPVDFIFSNQDRFLINLTIPDGYAVEKLPSSVSIPMSGNLINAKYIISANENKIQVSYTKEKNSPIILPEYYDELRAVYAEIYKKENEKIVLKKI